ncbi:MAG: YdeI/OmpD-associated family protein, partial [Fibrobacter sp.]|nr:YdeI/OmpD-associated family protein [Fibrobacter sp.]
DGMFTFNKITSLEDLPGKAELGKIIREAMELTDMGVKQKKAAPNSTELDVPDYLAEALAANSKAAEIFENASPSFRKEYILWLTDAKTETTRNKRKEQAIEWISEGKGRNWKYEKKN